MLIAEVVTYTSQKRILNLNEFASGFLRLLRCEMPPLAFLSAAGSAERWIIPAPV